MRRLIAFELKKLLRDRLVLFMMLLFLVLNGCHIYSGYAAEVGQETRYYAARRAVYTEVSGAWDMEKIAYVLAEYDKANAIVSAGNFSTEPDQPGTHTGYIFGDLGLFEQIKNEMDTRYHYADTMVSLTQRAAENADFYAARGNAYEAARNRRIAQTYAGRQISAFYDTWGWERYFRYDFSTLLILLLMLPMLAPLFAREHEVEMHGLLSLTPRFRTLTLCKLIAGMTATVLAASLLLCEDLLLFAHWYGLAGAAQPIYSLAAFAETPLSVSIAGYVCLAWAMKLLGFVTIAAVTMLISAVMKNEVLPFCMAFSAMLLLVLTDAFMGDAALSLANPAALFSFGRMLRAFAVTPICGMPVPTYLLPAAQKTNRRTDGGTDAASDGLCADTRGTAARRLPL